MNQRAQTLQNAREDAVIISLTDGDPRCDNSDKYPLSETIEMVKKEGSIHFLIPVKSIMRSMI